MNGVRHRLVECFRAVFPDLTDREIENAESGALESWDSICTVTLVAVVEEQFRNAVAPEDIDRFDSFENVLAYLTEREVNDGEIDSL